MRGQFADNEKDWFQVSGFGYRKAVFKISVFSAGPT
jgi:hypothetical protein